MGVSVISLPRGESLYSLCGDKLFTVASNMKLVTTACALANFGPKFEFKTKLYVRGKLDKSGLLDGDIIVRGGGDPNISGRFHEGDPTAIFKDWAARLKKKGIKSITGAIIADDTYFDRDYIADGWPRSQLSHWYCAEICGLSFNDNCIDITIDAGARAGAPVIFSTKPSTKYVRIVNECKTTSHKWLHSVVLTRSPGTNLLKLTGRFWIKAATVKESVTIHDPALYFVTVLHETFESEGIPCGGDPRLIRSEEVGQRSKWTPFLVATTPFSKTIAVTNKRSQNFYAEQILKTMGAEIEGDATFSGGLSVIEDFLRANLGYKAGSYEIADGSGLSRRNRLAPTLITDLLRFMYLHEYSNVFLESLATPGGDGTMRKRLTAEPYRSRVKAKTGSLRGVCALSGYVKTLKGKELAFSILVNSSKISARKARDVQDSVCKLLIDS